MQERKPFSFCSCNFLQGALSHLSAALARKLNGKSWEEYKKIIEAEVYFSLLFIRFAPVERSN